MSVKKRFTLFISTIICISLITLTSIAQDGRIVRETIYSPSLEGNLLGDSPNRAVTIYLPPSYDKGDNLYPVIYYLNGYSADNNMWTNYFYIHSAMNNLLKRGEIQEMIIVMPNGFNRYGGCFYTNSSVSGNYEDYIVKDIVKFIDNKYRSLRQSESRAIGGGSMGGYGAMKLAMKHPDIYCSVVSHSGVLSFNQRKDDIRLNPNYTLSGYPVYRAWAIALSPNPENPELFDYPADKNGNIREDVWNRWLEHDPVSMVKNYQYNLRKLAGIYFDHGKSDNIVSIEDARDFDKVLKEYNITHIYEEYSGDHTNQWSSRLYIALPFLSNLLSDEMLVGVEPLDKLAFTWGGIRK
jgi:S-formylglutathione hydrolase FrmB